MGIFRRVKDLLVAETNGMLDKCEQPLTMVNQYIRQFDQELAKGQRALANQLYIEKRQAALIAEAEAVVEKRVRQAKLAAAQGEEHIAKLALQEKLLHERKAEAYRTQYAAIQEQTKVLKERIGELLVQSEQFNHRRLLLESRVNVASSLKDLNRSVVSFQTDNVAKGFVRAEEQVLKIEAELEALQLFHSPSAQGAPQYLDPSLTAEIDRDLEQLKLESKE